mmetsp:Transcript_18611/g.31836  ORF Transcript_18611/g.31836 Transcript_18611/m.31836 type:complete len:101 (+) Transcript_18611:440-742(+)
MDIDPNGKIAFDGVQDTVNSRERHVSVLIDEELENHNGGESKAGSPDVPSEKNLETQPKNANFEALKNSIQTIKPLKDIQSSPFSNTSAFKSVQNHNMAN